MNSIENVVETTNVLSCDAPVLTIESWEQTESLGGFFNLSA